MRASSHFLLKSSRGSSRVFPQSTSSGPQRRGNSSITRRRILFHLTPPPPGLPPSRVRYDGHLIVALYHTLHSRIPLPTLFGYAGAAWTGNPPPLPPSFAHSPVALPLPKRRRRVIGGRYMGFIHTHSTKSFIPVQMLGALRGTWTSREDCWWAFSSV